MHIYDDDASNTIDIGIDGQAKAILNNHPAYGLIAHVVVNTYVTWARRYVTWAGMSMFVMVGVSRKAIWRII